MHDSPCCLQSPWMRDIALRASPWNASSGLGEPHPCRDYGPAMKPGAEAGRLSIDPLVASASRRQQVRHREEALNARRVRQALLQRPTDHHLVAHVLIHVPVPRKDCSRHVSVAVTNEAAVGDVAEALRNRGRARQVREQEDAALLHRKTIPAEQEVADVPRVVEVPNLEKRRAHDRNHHCEDEVARHRVTPSRRSPWTRTGPCRT